MVSNHFLSRLKRKYQNKKAGFSGTLDPFAEGVLIVAFGQFTKLFRFFKKTPKTYRATLWIGAYSPTLDSEKIEYVEEMLPFHPASVDIVLQSMMGDITYIPPKYSAKHVDGVRAYTLARSEKAFELQAITSHVFTCNLVHYTHPFLTFEITISEGGYIRSMGALMAEKFGFKGCLSALERLNEGDFVYNDEIPLNPLDYLDIPDNQYKSDLQDILLGRKLQKEDFEIQADGVYKIIIEEMLSIIEIKDDEVKYVLNTISLKA